MSKIPYIVIAISILAIISLIVISFLKHGVGGGSFFTLVMTICIGVVMGGSYFIDRKNNEKQ